MGIKKLSSKIGRLEAELPGTDCISESWSSTFSVKGLLVNPDTSHSSDPTDICGFPLLLRRKRTPQTGEGPPMHTDTVTE